MVASKKIGKLAEEGTEVMKLAGLWRTYDMP
jgi:hypothetical protein